MRWLKRALREPLLHFLLIGAAVFAAYGAVSGNEPETDAAREIRVTPEKAAQLAGRFQQTWQRKPSTAEMDALLRAYVDEEVLVREALALSMDQNDSVIRQRLAQKMVFLMESAASARTASEEELLRFYEDNKSDFAIAGRISFQQVFLGAGGAALAPQVESALAAGTPPDQLGAPTLLPQAMELARRGEVERTFGPGFFDALRASPEGAWSGPLRSAYGGHFVRVDAWEPGAVQPFDEVRGRIEAAWKHQAAQDLAKEMLHSLRESYDIALPDGAAAEPAQ